MSDRVEGETKPPTIRIPKWGEFQHYKNRNPPWIKLHRQLLSKRGWRGLDPFAAKLLVELWLVASESNDGNIELCTADLAWHLRYPETQVADIARALLDLANIDLITLCDHDASRVLAECKQVATPEGEERESKRESYGSKEPDGFGGKPPKIESPIPAVSGMFQVGQVLAGGPPPAPERKKAPEVKPVTDEEAAERFARCRSQLAPAIRLHAWQGSEPPCSPDRRNPWHMGRELSIAKELLKQFTPEELLGGIEYFRETHPTVASGPWTLAMAYVQGDRWRMMRAVDRWRSAQIDAIDPATLPTFTPHLSIHAA